MIRFRYLNFAFLLFVILLLIHSCANKGIGPTGGIKDTTPPTILQSKPINGVLNFKAKHIQIDFDENVSIEKPADNVFFSPPQIKTPEVKALGKRIVVDFEDDLKDSTTYTVSFGNGIVDVNEKNPLKDYQFAFSTGNEIDTLQIAGTVINAEDLNPISGVLVGIYSEMDDSIFSLKPFLRIARTDENGRFVVSNIKKGTYKVFALGDMSKDYFHQPGEGLALYDSIITPTFEMMQLRDSVWKDSLTADSMKILDSVHVYSQNVFFPNDLTLRYFKESRKRQYFVKAERKIPNMFKLYFNTAATALPQIKCLNADLEGKCLVQKNMTLDSITYWITDSTVWKVDTLKLQMKYFKTDSVFRLVSKTDTVNLIYRKPKISLAAQAKLSKKNAILEFKTNATTPFEVYRPVKFDFDEPVSSFDLSGIKLSQKIDTVYKELKYKWKQVDSLGMSYALDLKWIPEKSYKLEVDSASFTSIYNKVSKKLFSEFKVRSLDEYSKMKIFITPYNSKAVLQVLNDKDAVLVSKPALAKGTVFEYLKPGVYYLRMYIDENENGKWDTGELESHRHPETVLYYNKKLSLLANWEFEETWDTSLLPLLRQKPKELIKDAGKKKE
jgi:hypothetical protein